LFQGLHLLMNETRRIGAAVLTINNWNHPLKWHLWSAKILHTEMHQAYMPVCLPDLHKKWAHLYDQHKTQQNFCICTHIRQLELINSLTQTIQKNELCELVPYCSTWKNIPHIFVLFKVQFAFTSLLLMCKLSE
jgi:hypothetical protein